MYCTEKDGVIIMEIKEIRELAEIMKANDILHLELEEGHCRLVLEKEAKCCPSPAMPLPAPAAIPAPSDAAEVSEFQAEPVPQESSIEVRSPMVGVFYASKAPGEPPFISVGDTVKVGDTLCIIEAMKLMNDIAAEQGGRVVEICVKDGEIVEFGQVLFKLQ